MKNDFVMSVGQTVLLAYWMSFVENGADERAHNIGAGINGIAYNADNGANDRAT